MPSSAPVRHVSAHRVRLALLALGALVIPVSGADAQRLGCAITTYTDPPRDVLECSDGLSISAERASNYRLIDRDGNGRPEGAALTGKGMLIDLPPGRRRTPFQITTPHAIASVRGTVWAVDVSPTRTSVFVQEGIVAVRRHTSPRTVELRAGEGVDVDAAGQELRVNRWSRERALNLLARFGR
jgi:ferric-dicitrate binding protein FerR (iron transport regulator)